MAVFDLVRGLDLSSGTTSKDNQAWGTKLGKDARRTPSPSQNPPKQPHFHFEMTVTQSHVKLRRCGFHHSIQRQILRQIDTPNPTLSKTLPCPTQKPPTTKYFTKMTITRSQKRGPPKTDHLPPPPPPRNFSEA